MEHRTENDRHTGIIIQGFIPGLMKKLASNWI